MRWLLLLLVWGSVTMVVYDQLSRFLLFQLAFNRFCACLCAMRKRSLTSALESSLNLGATARTKVLSSKVIYKALI